MHDRGLGLETQVSRCFALISTPDVKLLVLNSSTQIYTVTKTTKWGLPIVGCPNVRKNPRWRTAAILKNRKMVISPKWHEIWRYDAHWPSEPDRQLKFRILKIQDGGRSPFWTIEKWPYIHNGLINWHEICTDDANWPCSHSYNLEFQKSKMADGHHLKTVKSQYLSNGSTDRQEIWHDDDTDPMNFTLPPRTNNIRFLFYVIKTQKLF